MRPSRMKTKQYHIPPHPPSPLIPPHPFSHGRTAGRGDMRWGFESLIALLVLGLRLGEASRGAGMAGMAGMAESERFERRKDALLEAISCGADRSKKGSFDAPIQEMLEELNQHPDYVSTSSCSGRIAIFWEPSSGCGPQEESQGDKEGKKTKGGQWLLCKHAHVTANEVLEAVALRPAAKGSAYFKHEPFILHVQCKSLDAATRLMEAAREAGFRESGVSLGRKHVIVGIRTSALRIEAPIIVDGELVVSSEYLGRLAEIANEKFTKNKEKSDHLHHVLKKSILSSPLNAEHEPDREREDSTGCWTVSCNPNICEEIRKKLLASGLLEMRLRNSKLEDGKVAIPIRAEATRRLKEDVPDGWRLSALCKPHL
eukprot:760443-Hanusia_phi.AAC.2